MMSVGLTFDPAADARAQAGLVGPNAVLQLAEALRAAPEDNAADRVFERAGLARLLRAPPDAMIDEWLPARLFEALWQELGPERAAALAYDAGWRTGAYVCANRIPKLARALLRVLPPRLAAPLLLKAIGKHAWTFAGSGQCRIRSGRPAVVTIAHNPLSMPGGVWHVGVFEYLFRALVNGKTEVCWSQTTVSGQPVCAFEIDYLAG